MMVWWFLKSYYSTRFNNEVFYFAFCFSSTCFVFDFTLFFLSKFEAPFLFNINCDPEDTDAAVREKHQMKLLWKLDVNSSFSKETDQD